MNFEIPLQVKFVIETLEQNGHEAFIVGGCVRDLIMSKIPNDYDVTTNALPEKVIEIFQNQDCKVIETGLKHGTVTVIKDSMHIEVTTYRLDGDYLDNRHPENVEFTSNLQEDLKRRDFTMNAIVYSNKEGIVDYFGGYADISRKIIRCVGDPDKRFNEDALRILRAIRFSSVLGFDIHKNTLDSIHNNKNLINNVSHERINTELSKFLCGEYIDKIAPEVFDVICTIIPQVSCKDYHKADSVIEHLYNYSENMKKVFIDIKKAPNKLETKLVAFFEGFKLSCDSAKEVMKNLRYSNKQIAKVCAMLSLCDNMPSEDKVQIKYAMKDYGKDNVLDLLEYKDAYKYQIAHSIIESGECYCLSMLALGGNDLIKLGIEQGKEIQDKLNFLLDKVIENPKLNEKQKLINLIK